MAVLFGVVSVLLSVRQNIWSWPTALVNVALYFVVFFQSGLYSDMGLQVVYFVLSIYGWYEWLYGGEGTHGALRVANIAAHVDGAVGDRRGRSGPRSAAITSRLPGAAVPYLDAATATTSLVAQYMMTRKLLENWIVWIVVDVVYVAMFIWRGLYLTAANYAIYLGLAVLGYVAWKRSLMAAVVIRVVLTGSESTGKTTLAGALARALRRAARAGIRARLRREARRRDPVQRSRSDRARADRARGRAHRALGGRLLIQDTDLLSTVVYCKHYFGRCPEWIEDAAQRRQPDLYLLCEPDIPWVADGVRDRGHMRDEMQDLFRDGGSRVGREHASRFAALRIERLDLATRAIDALLGRSRRGLAVIPSEARSLDAHSSRSLAALGMTVRCCST